MKSLKSITQKRLLKLSFVIFLTNFPQKELRVVSGSIKDNLRLNSPHVLSPSHPLMFPLSLMHSKSSMDAIKHRGDKEVKVMCPCVTAQTWRKTPATLINLQILQQQSEFSFDFICIAFSSFLVPPLTDVLLYALLMQDQIRVRKLRGTQCPRLMNFKLASDVFKDILEITWFPFQL